MAKQSTGDLINRHYTIAKDGDSDHYLETIIGNVENRSVTHKFGRNPNVSTTFAPITITGVFQTPTALTSLELVSSDANDTAAGTGARKIRIRGIGAGFLEVVQDVVTNGLTAVALSTQLLRINTWEVIESGTYANGSIGSHVGILTIREAGGGTTWTQIDNTDFPRGRSEIACLSIAAGDTAFISSVKVIAETNKTATVIAFIREDADIVSAPFTAKRELFVFDRFADQTDLRPKSPIGPIVGPADIFFDGKVDIGTGTIDVDFEIFIIKTPT